MDDYELAEERERQSFVEVLIRRDVLDGAALGVARQYVDRGERSLTDRQRDVLETHVFGEHLVKQCSSCSQDVPLSEQAEALDNGGMCGYCVHRWNKVTDE